MPSVAHDDAPTRPAPAGSAMRTRWLWLRAFFGASFAAVVAAVLLLAAGALALTALLPAYLTLEVLFAVHFFRRRARLSAMTGGAGATGGGRSAPRAVHEPEGHDGEAVFEKFMAIAPDVRRSTGIDGLLKCWYGRDTPFSEIYRGNAEELLVYGFFYRTQEQMRAAGKGDVGEKMLQRLEQAWDFAFDEGYNPKIDLMTHLWEPIKAHWRPLAFYAIMEAFALAKHWAMLAAGWQCARAPGGGTYYTYGMRATTAEADHGARLHDAVARGASAAGRARWSALIDGKEQGSSKASSSLRRRSIGGGLTPRATAGNTTPFSPSAALARQHAAAEAERHSGQTPILFCHGVGLGLAPYVPLVQRLAATGRPVIAVEFKHLAMRWTRRIPTVEEVADSLIGLLSSLGVARCDALSHSFGTFYASRMLRVRPDLVRTVSLLDPVCCCMWTGDLISNFVYRPHESRTGLTTWLIARDLHTAAAVSRNFFWSDYNLWPDMLPRRSLLAVGERDDLVPIAHVASTVAADAHSGGRVTLVSHPDRAHADVVFDPRWQGRVLAEVEAQLAAADEDDAAEAARAGGGAWAAGVAAEAAAAAAMPPVVPADVLVLGGGSGDDKAAAAAAAPTPSPPALRHLPPRAPLGPPLSIGSPSSPRTPAVEQAMSLLPSPGALVAGGRSLSPPLGAVGGGVAGGALAAFAASAAAAPLAPPSRSASAAAALRGSGTSTTSAWAAASYAAGPGSSVLAAGAGPGSASLTRQASLASAAGEALAPPDDVVAELRGFGAGTSRPGSGGAPSSLLSMSSGGSSDEGAEEGGAGAAAHRRKKGVLQFGGGKGGAPVAEPDAVKRALSSLLERQQLLQQPGSP